MLLTEGISVYTYILQSYSIGAEVYLFPLPPSVICTYSIMDLFLYYLCSPDAHLCPSHSTSKSISAESPAA